MVNENKTQAPVIKIDEILELLNSSEASGLTFQDISTHIYNNRRGFFDQEPSLRQIKTSLRNFFNSHKEYFCKDEHERYLFKEIPPKQLYFDFEDINDINEPQNGKNQKTTYKTIQLEFNFN